MDFFLRRDMSSGLSAFYFCSCFEDFLSNKALLFTSIYFCVPLPLFGDFHFVSEYLSVIAFFFWNIRFWRNGVCFPVKFLNKNIPKQINKQGKKVTYWEFFSYFF